jgi:hypothetical protein
VTKPI